MLCNARVLICQAKLVIAIETRKLGLAFVDWNLCALKIRNAGKSFTSLWISNFNSLMTEVSIIIKSVYWFSDQISMDWFLFDRDLLNDRVKIANSKERETFLVFREHKQNKIRWLYTVKLMCRCQYTYMLCSLDDGKLR